jgi:hypothetical protein
VDASDRSRLEDAANAVRAYWERLGIAGGRLTAQDIAGVHPP